MVWKSIEYAGKTLVAKSTNREKNEGNHGNYGMKISERPW